MRNILINTTQNRIDEVKKATKGMGFRYHYIHKDSTLTFLQALRDSLEKYHTNVIIFNLAGESNQYTSTPSFLAIEARCVTVDSASEFINILNNNKNKKQIIMLQPNQTLLLFKLRKVSNVTIYGSAIVSEAYSCYEKKKFNKIIKELKTSIDESPKMMGEILGAELLIEIKDFSCTE